MPGIEISYDGTRIQAQRAIALNQPVKQLFYWAFSEEGETLAAAVALEYRLPLCKRPE